MPFEFSPEVPIENFSLRCGSVASVSAWRLDVGEVCQVEIDDGLQGFAGGGLAEGVWQGVGPGITLMPLPPRAPELNPVENVWQFMRENWLSNRVFTSYEDIIDHCCFAWNKLTDQPWRIMSIGLRDWAHRF